MANGLVNLRTDLKSLRYGSMPLGSDAPYVTKDVNNPPSSNLTTMEITKRIDDTSRIAQMLVDRPGLKYLLHEAELKQIGAADKIAKAQKGGKSVAGAILGQLGSTAVGVAKLVGSTLAQVPVNGTGTHFVKEFRTDTYLQPSGENNRSAFAQFFGAGGIEGAQYALRGEEVPGTHPSELLDTPSNFDYTEGQVFTDRNEKQNSKQPENSATKATAQEGNPIALPGSSIETTGNPNIQNPQNLINSKDLSTVADTDNLVGQQDPKDQKYYKYSDGNGKAKNNTESNIVSALAGQSIETAGTTPTNYVGLTSISNQTSSSLGVLEPTPTNKYSAESTYTGTDTLTSTLNAQTGSVIRVIPGDGSFTNINGDTSVHLDSTARKGTIGIPNNLKEIVDLTGYQNPSIFTTEDQLPGPPPEYTDEGKYLTQVAQNHQETWGEPLKNTTINFTNPGRTSEISSSDATYVHPSIFTNKYLGNSEDGPVPDPAMFADGELVTYSEYQSILQQLNWDQPLQDTTVPEGSIGRTPDRDPEVDNVQRYLPHVISEILDSTGPPPSYDPGDTYLALKKNIPTFNKNVVKENRVGLGEQGGRNDINKLTNSYWTTTPDKWEVDSVNALDISTTRLDATQEARDFAKLYFEIITPDGQMFLHFRAFIDNVDDSYAADWQGQKYVGRAEDFYTYAGFSRDINISFKVVAATRSELKPLYKKMIYLASSTAPTYGGEGFMRGTIARMTVGSYFDQIPGVITSVKYNLIEELPWEINMLGPEGLEDGVQEIPTGLQCSVSFKPIHDFAPQTGLYHYFTSKEKGKTFFDDDRRVEPKPPKETPPVKTEPAPNPPPKKEPAKDAPVKQVVPQRVIESTATNKTKERRDREIDRTVTASGIKPKKTIKQTNEEFKKTIEDSRKKKKYDKVNT